MLITQTPKRGGLNSNGVRTVVEVSDQSLLPSWYRVYSDGWCEQGSSFIGATTSNNVSTSFMKEFLNTDFNVQLTQSIGGDYSSNSSNTTYDWVAQYGGVLSRAGTTLLSTTSFSIARVASGSRIYWRASGYIK